MRHKNRTPFTSALIISTDRRHLRLDRDALTRAGVPDVRVSDNAKKALASILESPVDVVLIDGKLGKASGLDVLRVMRGHPRFAAMPVVVASLGGDKVSVLDALAAGCSGYLVRPYSEKALVEQLERATVGSNPDAARLAAMHKAKEETRRGALEQARKQFQKATPTVNEAEVHYTKAMEELGAGRYAQAIKGFSRALSSNVLYVEAHLGMASAYSGQGHDSKARKCLHRAAKAYAQREKQAELKALVIRILDREHAVANPFMDLGFELVRQGDFDSAASVYALGAKYLPSKQEVNASAARACMFTTDPLDSAKQLSGAMRTSGSGLNAHGVIVRIMGDLKVTTNSKAYYKDAPVVEAGSDSILNDLWTVAKYTCKAYFTGQPSKSEPLSLDLL